MSELNIKLLELIDKKYTINEIVNELNISREQLYKIFRKLKKLGLVKNTFSFTPVLVYNDQLKSLETDKNIRQGLFSNR